MAKYLIYHNPKCSKSRQALKLLEEKNLDFEIKELVRPKEAKEEGVDKNAGQAELIKSIANHPRVLQRPVVVTKAKAVIARDEDWLSRL